MPQEKNELELLREISEKMDRLIGLVAIQGKDRDAQLQTLYELGFDSNLIGSMVGMLPSNVRKWKSKRSSTTPKVDRTLSDRET